MPTPFSEEPETTQLLELASGGDAAAAGALLERHRERLARMVRSRLDRRLQGRIDESDVLQDLYLEASRRFPRYLKEERPLPFLLWLRCIGVQVLVCLHRAHLGAQARDPRREVQLAHHAVPGATSDVLAAQLVGKWTDPCERVLREDLRRRVLELLEAMDPNDREVLSLRHFEQLSNAEAALELEINGSAASKRYLRALARLKEAFASIPGGATRWL
ncbi:MAG: sigma-70 family RNA polymerase sigma factor [Planctomycetes bacterium]|nr:sigma-70 family RNA polymerase sigma factor [Planctomycetota bacterium]